MSVSPKTRACPFCDHRNLSKANYCAWCGRQLQLTEEKGQQARVVLSGADDYLKTAKTWVREWKEGGRPPGARMAVVARIEQYEKRLAKVRDDAKCPRKERVESKRILGECAYLRVVLETKAFRDLR